MHTRGQGCIYEIYQYSVKSTEAPGDGYVFQEEFVYMKNREKTEYYHDSGRRSGPLGDALRRDTGALYAQPGQNCRTGNAV